ncbi:MAG: sensor histidine kinase [Lachnospiraceae bacterium]|nr:sensor histidine kinase [Lachnospiraceae bacterium]
MKKLILTLDNLLKKLRLRERIGLIIASLFVPYVIIVAILLYSLLTFYSEYNMIGDNIVIANKYNVEFKEDMDAVMYQMVIRAISKDAVEEKLGTKSPDTLIEEAAKDFTALRQTSHSRRASDTAGSINNLLNTLQDRVNDINLTVKQSGYYDENMLSLDTNIRIITQLIQERISEYNYYEAESLEHVRAALQSRVDFIIRLTIILFLVVTAFSLTLVYSVSRSISSSVEELRRLAEEYGRGNLDARAYDLGDVEFNVLNQTFNGMADRIGDLIENVRQAEVSSRDLELKLLQAQINPHFLYNTLDNIIWLVEDDRKEDAENIVTYLSQFFRTTLSGGRDFITLKEEFAHIKAYLKIQAFRYRDILSFEMELPEELSEYLIIKMALQPIVENALYHGIKYKRSMGKITVRASDAGENISIVVTDDGIGMEGDELSKLRIAVSEGHPNPDDSGFGMANVSERLRMNYGETYGLFIESEYGKGTTVEILIPKTNA